MSASLPDTSRRGSDWQFRLLGALASPTAPRVLTTADFNVLVRQFRVGAVRSTANTMINRLSAAGALRRVTSGVYLNRRALPPAETYEAAAYVRRGAIVSLHTVLGEVGALNNPSAAITCVLPSSARHRPRLGEITTSANERFRFYGLAERFFPQDTDDRVRLLQPGRPCAMFRPEAALLHWLHLASNARSSLTPPPQDLDPELLDPELLGELAHRWNLVDALEQYRSSLRDAS